MKITLITACYNSEATIRTAIDSVLSQKGVDIEYIIVDGGSKDGTVEILKGYEKKFLNLSTFQPFNFRWLSEKDSGMYDAINKGIKMATGDVVGILNADDVLASDDTLAHIVSAFNTDSYPLAPDSSRIDAVYADIRFVREGETVEAVRNAKTVRYCSARRWRPWMFRFAAMVPHLSLHTKRRVRQ